MSTRKNSQASHGSSPDPSPKSEPVKNHRGESEESAKTLGLRLDLVLRKKLVENHIFGFTPRLEKKVTIPTNVSLRSTPEGIIITGEK